MPLEGAGSRPLLNISPVPAKTIGSQGEVTIGTLWDSHDSTVRNHGTKALLFLGMTDFTAVDCAEFQGLIAEKKSF